MPISTLSCMRLGDSVDFSPQVTNGCYTDDELSSLAIRVYGGTKRLALELSNPNSTVIDLMLRAAQKSTGDFHIAYQLADGTIRSSSDYNDITNPLQDYAWLLALQQTAQAGDHTHTLLGGTTLLGGSNGNGIADATYSVANAVASSMASSAASGITDINTIIANAAARSAALSAFTSAIAPVATLPPSSIFPPRLLAMPSSPQLQPLSTQVLPMPLLSPP